MEKGIILKREWAMLKNNGYDAVSMRYANMDKRFIDTLSQEINNADAAAAVSPGTTDIRVGIAGLFGGGKGELVHFNFQYKYNGWTRELQLLKVSGRLGDTRLDFLLSQDTGIPKSLEIYAALKKEIAISPVQENKESNTWRKQI